MNKRLHIKKNTLDKNSNTLLLLIPALVFVITLAIALSFIRASGETLGITTNIGN